MPALALSRNSCALPSGHATCGNAGGAGGAGGGVAGGPASDSPMEAFFLDISEESHSHGVRLGLNERLRCSFSPDQTPGASISSEKVRTTRSRIVGPGEGNREGAVFFLSYNTH